MALKVAAILAALEWPQSEPVPVVEIRHLARAESIVEDWRHSLHRAIQGAAKVDLDDLVARVASALVTIRGKRTDGKPAPETAPGR